MLETPSSAALPALYAAASHDTAGGKFCGPSGRAHMADSAGEQKLYSRLAGADKARRVWSVSEELTGQQSPA